MAAPGPWAETREPPVPAAPIIGSGEATRALLAEVHRCAMAPVRVLIVGETGVGKELIASHIHRLSPRRHRAFIAVHCAGLAETLLESELFGHTRGSFTGAYRDKPGKFELADGGTLFLDEVGEMTPRMQGLLLRVLETGEIQRVGQDSARPRRVDARIVAATNRDLRSMVQAGTFREDLYYRLNVFQIRVPPLRERGVGDIRALIDHFLQRWTGSGGEPRQLAEETYRVLEASPWPGNVRQLQGTLQRVLITSPSELVRPEDLPSDIRTNGPAAATLASPRHSGTRSVADVLYNQIQQDGCSFWEVVHGPFMNRNLTKEDVRGLVRRALVETHGHYTAVTRLLRVQPAEYKRFLEFLRKHDCLLDFREFRQLTRVGSRRE